MYNPSPVFSDSYCLWNKGIEISKTKNE